MIIVKLMGGHSNQLFQYAAGRRLAKKHNTELLLDLSWFDSIDPKDTPRFYELGCYPLKANIADMSKVEIRNQNETASRLERLKHRLGKDNRVWALAQVGNGFNRNVLTAPNNTMLVGWWQTEKFFKDIRPELLDELEPSDKPNKKNQTLINLMKQTESIFIHVRRGDYASNAHAKAFHGLKDQDYYYAAFEKMLSHVPKSKRANIHIFLASNDLAWSKKNLKFSYPVSYLDNKNGSDDMRVGKHCKHDICSNSSFSWWAAWLNENPDKIVVAPKTWFEDEQANAETEIVPAQWLRI